MTSPNEAFTTTYETLGDLKRGLYPELEARGIKEVEVRTAAFSQGIKMVVVAGKLVLADNRQISVFSNRFMKDEGVQSTMGNCTLYVTECVQEAPKPEPVKTPPGTKKKKIKRARPPRRRTRTKAAKQNVRDKDRIETKERSIALEKALKTLLEATLERMKEGQLQEIIKIQFAKDMMEFLSTWRVLSTKTSASHRHIKTNRSISPLVIKVISDEKYTSLRPWVLGVFEELGVSGVRKKNTPTHAKAKPFASQYAREKTRATSSNADEYCEDLYPEFEDSEELLAHISKKPFQRWLDIGCGHNFKDPNSLGRIIKSRDIPIDFHGCDISFDPETALLSEQAYAEHAIGDEEMEKFNLTADPAQKLSYPDNHFDVVISRLVFDKFDQKNQGLHIALLETWRVLKPTGEARISPIMLRDSKHIDETLFDVEIIGLATGISDQSYSENSPTEELSNRLGVTMILKKKPVSERRVEAMKAEVKAWQDKHSA